MSLPTLTLVAALAFAKGPYLHELGESGVTVRFELAAAGPATVEVAKDGVKVAVVDKTPTSYHSVRIEGLAPATTYGYLAQAGGASEAGTFTTAPASASAAPFSFLVYGDNRSDDASHAAVVKAMLATPADFFVHTGDFVQDGGDPDDWARFFEIERPLLRDRASFASVGNHDLMDRGGASYLRYFGPSDLAAAAAPPRPAETIDPGAPLGLPRADGGTTTLQGVFGTPLAAPPSARARLFWTFRWGSARFFMLNAFDTWTSGEERAWLEAELARAKGEPGVTWRFAVVHHGPWSSGPHGGNTRLLAAGVPELLVRSGIDLVFAGHDHIYERGAARGLRYVVSGGGGAPLYKVGAPVEGTRKAESAHHFVEVRVAPDALKITAKRVDGSLLEQCGLRAGQPTAPWDCDPPPAVSTATAPPPPPASRCGCRVPGANVGGSGGIFLLVPLGALAYARRRCARLSPSRRSRWVSRF